MLFTEGVIPPPTDRLLRPFPLSYQQGPVKVRIHWDQEKLSALRPALPEALRQAIQLLRMVLSAKDQLAEDWVHTVNTHVLRLSQLGFPEAPAGKAPSKPNVLILHLRYVPRAWQHCVNGPLLRADAKLTLRVAAHLGQP